MLSIYTFTMGRWKYLEECINSVTKSFYGTEYEHHICFQGVKPDLGIKVYGKDPYVKFHLWDKNYGIAEGMNRIIPELKGDTIIKLDEDASIVTRWAGAKIERIRKLKPNLVFSPYPVGLIGNPGGPKGIKHEVVYDEEWDRYYTFRYVTHIGGFARIAPANLVKGWKFAPDLMEGQSGNEDGQHSIKCIAEGIEMAYLECGLIVEHQESTLGQHERYKEYFKNRRI